jgi:hypothetical protein
MAPFLDGISAMGKTGNFSRERPRPATGYRGRGSKLSPTTLKPEKQNSERVAGWSAPPCSPLEIMSSNEPQALVKERENPWPNGAEHGMYRILSIGINRSGQDSGAIDYSINTAAVRRMVETGRMDELMRTIEELKGSVTISKAIEGDPI